MIIISNACSLPGNMPAVLPFLKENKINLTSPLPGCYPISMAGDTCQICGKGSRFAVCLGCEKALCESCSRFELIGSGCGSVWPAYYCPFCALDPLINPNASFREPGL